MSLIQILPIGQIIKEIGQLAMASIAIALEVDASDVAPFQKYEPSKFAPGGGVAPEPVPVVPKVVPAKPVDPVTPAVPVVPAVPVKPDANKPDASGNVPING